MQLLMSLLPWQPLKLPQQRAWTAACCVTMLQQHYQGEGRSEEACPALAQKSGMQLYHCEMHPSQVGSVGVQTANLHLSCSRMSPSSLP